MRSYVFGRGYGLIEAYWKGYGLSTYPQALGMVRGHCAMKPAEKIEEGGTYNRATQVVVVHGLGDKDIRLIRAILAASGHYAMDMRDTMRYDGYIYIVIDAMGIPGPEGHPNAARGAEREKDSVYPIGDGEKQKARSLSKKKGPTMGLEPTWV